MFDKRFVKPCKTHLSSSVNHFIRQCRNKHINNYKSTFIDSSKSLSVKSIIQTIKLLKFKWAKDEANI